MKSQYDTIFSKILTSPTGTVTIIVDDDRAKARLRAGLTRVKRVYENMHQELGELSGTEGKQYNYEKDKDNETKVTISLITSKKTTFTILD